jgi:hypothetical protein
MEILKGIGLVVGLAQTDIPLCQSKKLGKLKRM